MSTITSDSVLNVLQSNLRFLDREELTFREHLLDSTGKGRLTGQDASFSHSRASAPSGAMSFTSAAYKRRSLAQVHDSRSSLTVPTKGRARSSSVGADGVFPPPLPQQYGRVQHDANKAVKKRFSVSRLLSKDKDSFPTVSNGTLGRRGSRVMSGLRDDHAFNGDGE